MLPVTISLAALFCIIALFVRPGVAFSLIIASMLVWPDYLRIPMGPALMSVSRLLTIVILIRFLMQGRGRNLKFGLVDGLIIAEWFWLTLANIFADGNLLFLTRSIGTFFDTVLVYFAARLCIQNSRDILYAGSTLGLVAVGMGGLGIYESITNYSPYDSLIKYRRWETIFGEVADEKRLGFYRAKASDSVHIYFGLTMAAVGGILVAFRAYSRGLFGRKLGVVGAYLGTLSSFSSGPWISAVAFFVFTRFYSKKKYIQPVIWVVLLVLVLFHVISSRGAHFLISYLALNPTTAWYRAKVIDVAISELDKYWLFGFGASSPNYWGALVDGRHLVDIVNHYIIVATKSGLPGFFIFVCISIFALRKIYKTSRLTRDRSHDILLFMLGCLLLSFNVAILSVGLFGTSLKMYYIVLAVILSVCSFPIIKQERKSKIVQNL